MNKNIDENGVVIISKEVQISPRKKTILKIVCDTPRILSRIISLKDDFEEDCYVNSYTLDEDGFLTREEYDDNIDEFIKKFNYVVDNLDNYLDIAEKKKNGTFKINRIAKKIDCDNSIFFTEWHNSWKFNRVHVKAFDDTTLRVNLVEHVDTPC